MMYEKDASGRETPGFEDYLAAIRQRKLLVLITALAVLSLAILFTLTRTSNYSAAARVLVNPTAVGSTNGSLVRPALERQSAIVASNTVAERVANDLQLSQNGRALLTDLDVTFVDGSDSLKIEYTSTDPELAQQVVNSFAQQYVSLRVEQADDLGGSTIGQLQDKITAIETELAELNEQIQQLTTERSRLLQLGSDTSAVNDQIATARTEISALLVERRIPTADLADAELAESTRLAPAEVLQFAAVPEVPDGFSDGIVRALGLILGLGFGVALAFVLNRLDRTVRETGDVELALGSNVLGSIPRFGLAHRSGPSSVVMISGGRSARIQQARESFRRLRSALQFLGSSRGSEVYLITSARPAEGKSTVSVNLAVALAQAGTKVCLVNADLRRPMVEKLLGARNERGLATWLADNSITDIMVAVADIPDLVLVPAGPPPANPGELLATGGLPSLLTELRAQFDIVLVDAPPVLSTADAATISRFVDGTVVIVDAGQTDTDALYRVRSELDRSGGAVIGAVLNRDSSDTGLSMRKDRYVYQRASAARSLQ